VSDQIHLFAVPKRPRAIRLGPNQLAVLERVKRHGDVRVREAGRIVYIRRGWRDPSRAGADWLDRAGISVLASLRRLGLLSQSRRDGRWILTPKGRSSDALLSVEPHRQPSSSRTAAEPREPAGAFVLPAAPAGEARQTAGSFVRKGPSISGGRSDGNAARCSDLIGPERSEGPSLAPSAQHEATLPVHAEDSPANPGKERCSAPSISAAALEDARRGRWGS
jgi:hypothetical protein